MIPDNVTLIVKAPNQQIEDQNVECLSSWTIGELKGYLSEVYPSKPRKEEQKIIYSGQLLEDSAILKDVLRTYESQIAHTMHLVCTPSRRFMATVKETPKPPSPEGLRRRVVADTPVDQPTEAPLPEMRQNDQNHTVEMQNYLSSFANNYGRVPPYPNYSLGEGYLPAPNDPAGFANHMLMMQQAYLQYMQQYANMWQATANGGQPAPQEPPPQPAAPEAPPQEEDGMARDWLDHIYAASRLAILFSFVYLYGSPARFLLALLIPTVLYLHQMGFFRDLHLNNQQADNAARPNQAQNVNRAENQAGNQPAQNNNPVGQNAEQLDQNAERPGQNVNHQPAENGNQADNAIPPTASSGNDNLTDIDPQQSLLAVTWMIFTSFFASLLPESN